MLVTDTVLTAITQATGQAFRLAQRHAVGGGCINSAEVLAGTDGRSCFVKFNQAERLPMFEAEAEGLRDIAASNSVRCPLPVTHGMAGHQAFLVLEYLELAGRGNSASDRRLGHQLAALHRVTADRFGWRRDNTIGATPQVNTRERDWLPFFREHRLRFQLERAAKHGAPHLLATGERLLDVLPAFFSDYRPLPSLLHGDLWGGNHGALRDGTPVIFDPAVYFGDREADLAMTELFGGFGSGFQSAYRESWPLDPGYRVRRDLYNLYHVLNHFNLFGGGYASQSQQLMHTLLSEAGSPARAP